MKQRYTDLSEKLKAEGFDIPAGTVQDVCTQLEKEIRARLPSNVTQEFVDAVIDTGIIA